MVIGLIFLVTYPANICCMDRDCGNNKQRKGKPSHTRTPHPCFSNVAPLLNNMQITQHPCLLHSYAASMFQLLHTAPLFPITPSYLIYRHTLTYFRLIHVLATLHPYILYKAPLSYLRRTITYLINAPFCELCRILYDEMPSCHPVEGLYYSYKYRILQNAGVCPFL